MFAPDRLLAVAVCRREADGSQTEPGTCSPRPCLRPTCLTVPSISVNGGIVSPQRTHTGNTILSSIASAAGLKATSPLLPQLTAWSAPRRGHQTRLFYRGRDVFMCASLPCTSGSAGAAWGLLGNADSQAPPWIHRACSAGFLTRGSGACLTKISATLTHSGWSLSSGGDAAACIASVTDQKCKSPACGRVRVRRALSPPGRRTHRWLSRGISACTHAP